MRLLRNAVALFIVACAWIHVVKSSQVPLLVRLGLRRSRIPQFVLEMEHPWVLENMAILERLDAADALCNAESPLRSQLPAVPADLFKVLRVDRPKSIQLGWDNVRDRLSEIQSCAAALRTCECFRVHLYGCWSGYDGRGKDRALLGVVPRLFVHVLSQMGTLQNLEWIGPFTDPEMMAIFEETFRELQLYLPTVKQMHLGPNMHFLVPLAPELAALATTHGAMWEDNEAFLQPWKDLIGMARSAKKLTSFRMSTEWDTELVETVLNAMPFLHKLGLANRIGPMYDYESGSTAGQRLKNIVLILKEFKELSTLHLPRVSKLGLSDDYGSGCGNAYFGIGGTKFGRVELRQDIVDIELASSIVLEHLPHLGMLCIGSRCTSPENQTKEGRLMWPWTGRMREYLLEIWPRYKAVDSNGDDGMGEDPDGPVFTTWEEDEAMLDENWVTTWDDTEYFDLEDLAYSVYWIVDQRAQDQVDTFLRAHRQIDQKTRVRNHSYPCVLVSSNL